ncbi:MAG: A/G-specific adenine glycosylase [Saprospiraceae bacterium]
MPAYQPTPAETDHLAAFRRQLLDWYRPADRPMPWKEEADPYLIWLSEIILQQTRVEQGLNYYLAFRAAYPTVAELAAAPADDVMKLWAGLGYYSRARNLRAAAQKVIADFGGKFPASYDDLLSLPGVGPYTAAAIASFAFGLPHAVLDGNVYRVLARYLDRATPIDSTPGKHAFTALAQTALAADRPARYNQAVMDFGATVCTPRLPACPTCPLAADCLAYRNGRVEQLPVKTKKTKVRDRFFHYLVLNQGDRVWIHRREEQDIWQALYQFPLLEVDHAELDRAGLREQPDWRAWFGVGDEKIELRGKTAARRHILSHQRIHGVFWELSLPSGIKPSFPDGYRAVKRKNLSTFAFPKLIDSYLSQDC